MNVAFISAVLPVLLLLWFVRRKDNLNPEPVGKLILAFFMGCLSVVPAAVQEMFLSSFAPSHPVLEGVYTGYVVAGLVKSFGNYCC